MPHDNPDQRGLGLRAGQESTLPTGKSWFFGVGINTYEHFPRLNNARKDVEDMLQLLQERYQLNGSTTLFDEAATRSAIINGLYKLHDQLQENDKLFIFYSGHGHLDDRDRGYWLPVDASPERVDMFIRSSTVRELVQDIGCRHILLVSDSCFSGALLARDVNYVKAALEELERDRSRWVISSGRQREPVADGSPGKNSPFTGSILRVLRENQDSGLNAGLLFDKVTKLTRFNYRQMPQSGPLFGAGHEGGQYIFHLKADEAADWKACQNTGTLAAYQAFLTKYPEGTHAREASEQIGFLEEEQAWKAARGKDTVNAYLQYRRAYPSGRYREQALELIQEREEEQDWQRALRRHAIFSYEQYLEKYPAGRYRKEAELKMQALLAGQQEPTGRRKAEQQEQQESQEKKAAEQRRRIRVEAKQQPSSPTPQPESLSPPLSSPSEPSSNWRKWLPIGLGGLVVVVLVIWGISQMGGNTSPSVQSGEVTLQGQTYRTLTINGTTWLAENLNYEVPDSWCYDDDPANCRQYGRLYSWAAAKKACAALGDGWMLPTDAEWREMAQLFGGTDDDAWDGGKAAYQALIEGGSSSFDALLGGWRYGSGRYDYLGSGGQYWSATAHSADNAWDYNFNRNSGALFRSDGNQKTGLSCRCLQDDASTTTEPESKNEAKKTGSPPPPSTNGAKKPGSTRPTLQKGEATLQGQTYNTLTINGTTWLAENLNYEVTDSWCYDDEPANCQKYGRLYTWEAAKKACAALRHGWRLPTDGEWRALRDHYGNNKDAYDALIKGGASGFNAPMGGWRDSSGSYNYVGGNGSFWNATASGSGRAWSYYFYRNYGELSRRVSSQSMGLSCRCIRD